MSDRLGCIADDYTGATDLSSMLVRTGRRVVQCFGVPDVAVAPELVDADVVVIALKSRSVPTADAVAMAMEAALFLRSLGMDRFFWKYCSTFDSTARGNIGPVADALADAIGAGEVWFCPAFPENGRTVHCGYLFVDGVPLHETGMRNHPLNPMTDSNLVRVLQAQTTHPVGWRSPGKPKPTTLASRWIIDARDDADLRQVAQGARDHTLLTGGSAVAGHWADQALVRRSGAWPDEADSMDEDATTIVLAGSCSDATRAQIAEFETRHPSLHFDPSSIEPPSTRDTATREKSVAEVIAWCDEQRSHGHPAMLVTSSADADAVAAARSRWGEQAAAERTEAVFASLVEGLFNLRFRRFIVAGGETSGAVVNALGIRMVRIGCEIAPGVPWVHTLRFRGRRNHGVKEQRVSLALKSGNFGGPRFFVDAMQAHP